MTNVLIAAMVTLATGILPARQSELSTHPRVVYWTTLTRPIAEAIISTGAYEDEQRALVTLSFKETTFGRLGRIPFGLSCCYRPGMTLTAAAERALFIWRWAAKACGPVPERQFAFYQSGRCRENAYGSSAAGTMLRVRTGRLADR